MSERATWHAAFNTLDALANALERAGQRGWLVGGCLRDAQLGLPVRDLDLAVTGDPRALLGATAGVPGPRAVVPLQRAVRIVLGTPDTLTLDITPVHDGDIAADLARRDFTLNALALPLAARDELLALSMPAADSHEQAPSTALPSLLDPLGGRADLRARRLVVAGADALRADPVRIPRGARLVAALNLTAPNDTLRRMREAAPGLAAVARERLSAELSLLFSSAGVNAGWRVLHEGGALPWLFPELRSVAGMPETQAEQHLLDSQAALSLLHPAADASASESAALAALAGTPELRAWLASLAPHGEPRMALLRWGILAHALASHIAPPANESPATSPSPTRSNPRLPDLLPGGAARAVARAVGRDYAAARQLLLAPSLSRIAWRSFFERVRGVEDAAIYVVLAALACEAALATDTPKRRPTLERMTARAAEVLGSFLREPEVWRPPMLVTGDELIRQLGIASGPQVGQVLKALRQAQLEERVTTPDEALALARALAAAHPRPSPPAT